MIIVCFGSNNTVNVAPPPADRTLGAPAAVIRRYTPFIGAVMGQWLLAHAASAAAWLTALAS